MRKLAGIFVVLLLTAAACSVDALPRDAQQVKEFKKTSPCPSTGKSTGACPGYQVDHTRALMNGGKDKPKNMKWLATEQHKAKTKQDFAECKNSYSCKHKTAAKRLPWQKPKKAKKPKKERARKG